MKGDAKQLIEFLDGAKNRFIIPVYQRNYDWNEKQCRQLFDDLIQISVEKRKSHFFGSIVSTHASDGSKSDYLIIDGQQRITTISLLFTAMVNLLKSGILKSQNETLQQEIEETFLVDKYRKEERKLRLKPIKDDMEAFDKLLIQILSQVLTLPQTISSFMTKYRICLFRLMNFMIQSENLKSLIFLLRTMKIRS